MTLRTTVTATAFFAVLVPAWAEDGCDKFAWSLARERTLFSATDQPMVNAGEALSGLPKTAITLRLQPGTEAAFTMPPERKPKAERWFGGMLRLPAPNKAGIYQVTLSEEAWIDVVQDGHYARSVGSSGRSDCPGLRKSVRFDLSAAPAVLQISGVAAEQVMLTIGARD